MNDYVEQVTHQLKDQKEALFTDEIRLSKKYANMHGNINKLIEDEKELLTLCKKFDDVYFYLKTRQYRDEANLAKEKIKIMQNLSEEISNLVKKIEWRT